MVSISTILMAQKLKAVSCIHWQNFACSTERHEYADVEACGTLNKLIRSVFLMSTLDLSTADKNCFLFTACTKNLTETDSFIRFLFFFL